MIYQFNHKPSNRFTKYGLLNKKTCILIFALCIHNCTKNCKKEYINPPSEEPNVTDSNIFEIFKEQIKKYLDPVTPFNLTQGKKTIVDAYIKKQYDAETWLSYYKDMKYAKHTISNINIESHWNRQFSFKKDEVGKVIQNFQDANMSYKQDTNDTAYYTTDFANKFLGGGVLDHGFVQEEQQWLETGLFLLAAHRVTNQDANYELKNNEIAILSQVPRFFSIDAKKSYTQANNNPDIVAGNLSEYCTACKPVQKYNIVAIDAPCFSVTAKPHKNGYTNAELSFLFGKLVCAYAACKNEAKGQGKKEVHIITGNLGMGAFNNNGDVVYSLNILAALVLNAEAKGPKIVLEAYTFDQVGKNSFENSIQAINNLIKKEGTNVREICTTIGITPKV